MWACTQRSAFPAFLVPIKEWPQKLSIRECSGKCVCPLPGCKTLNDTYSDLNIVLYFEKKKWPPVLFTYIHKYPNNLLEDEIQCIVGVNMHGHCCDLLLYNSCTTEVRMTKQLTQHLRVEHIGEALSIVQIEAVPEHALTHTEGEAK